MTLEPAARTGTIPLGGGPRCTSNQTPNPASRRTDVSTMSDRVNVRILLLVGDQAEVVADTPDPATPERYPAAVIAEAVGLPARELPGRRLTAEVGAGRRLTGWALR